MKKYIFILMVMATFALLTNVGLKAQTMTLGEIQPCTGTQLIGCDWEGPYTFMYSPSDCQGCMLIVEFYAKGLEIQCDGNFAIQITRIFSVKKVDGYQSYLCSQCLGNLQDRFNESYAKIFKYYENYIGLHTTLMMIRAKIVFQMDWTWLTFENEVIFEDLTIPVVSMVNFNPIYFPDYVLGDQDIAIKVISFVQVCSSDCCCYELESYWNRMDPNHPILLTLYNGTPCSNVDYECTDGCSGGCSDLLFGWSNTYGMMYGKIGFSTKNFNNDISISPNPNQGAFTISFDDNLKGMLDISLADMKGTVLGNFQFNKQDESFTTDLRLNYPNGSYIMLFEIGVFIGSQKVTINK